MCFLLLYPFHYGKSGILTNRSYFFFLDEAISTLRMTKTRATERRNLRVTQMASSRRPGVYLFWSSFTSVPSRVSMNCTAPKQTRNHIVFSLTHWNTLTLHRNSNYTLSAWRRPIKLESFPLYCEFLNYLLVRSLSVLWSWYVANSIL